MLLAKDKDLNALVIDDDSFMLELISTQLSAFGFETRVAENGLKASKILKEGYEPSIIIVDMIMPEKEGLETIIYFKQRLPEIKVIAISAGGSFTAGDLLDYARKFGADAAFTKPIDLDLFEKTISSLFSLPSAIY